MEKLNTEQKPEQKENALLNIGLNVVIPSIILTKFSGDEHLGQIWSLVIALAFPISYGLFDFIKQKKFNFFSALGLFSVIMTGGIGLFNLNRDWMIAKETGIPFIMGLVVIASQYTKFPLVRAFLNQVLDLDKIDESFKKHGHEGIFEKKMAQSSFYLGGTFFISALLNYILAVEVLVGQPGTTEFNESLGKMTALSFPVISLPMVIMVGVIIWMLIKSIKEMTDLEIESVLKNQ